VAAAERALGEAGFSGCRVRLSPVDENACLVELRRTDFDDNLLKLREIIIKSLRGAGFGRFFLDLDGRI
jgi:PP-loop superfamily ATP-utilizing enzyme